MSYTHPNYLVTAEEVNAHLDDSDWRIFDTAVYLTPEGTGGYRIDSGTTSYEQGHIPGAGFIDLVEDWADTTSPLRFTLPERAALQSAIGASGISPEHRVVLYSSGHLMWATRAWWLLYHAGHRNVAILNGNLAAWKSAGLPLETGSSAYPATTFAPDAEEVNGFASTAEVERGMHGAVCTINALTRTLYEGTGDFYYVRRGHIPGSFNLYYDALLDNEFFKPADELRTALAETGALDAQEVITYCGGGIAATLDAFACLLVGQESVRVYDGSMSEWVADPERPLTEGAQP